MHATAVKCRWRSATAILAATAVFWATAGSASAGAAGTPSPWITLPTTGGEQVRVQFLAAARTPRVCVRFGNCRHGPKGDYVVFTLRLQSVSLTRECAPRNGLMCAGEFSNVFAFGPGIKACPGIGPSAEEAEQNLNICAPGRFSWSNTGGERPGGLGGGDFGSPGKVVGNFTPGKTITYRYLLTLAYAPGYDRRVRSLADIWMSLNGTSYGPAANFARLSTLWPGGRFVHVARVR